MKKYIPIGLSIITSFAFLGSKSFNFDEAFSILHSRNLAHLLHELWTNEGNMWFYYILLHFWQMEGQSEFFIRSLSALFGILSIFVIYKLGKKLYSEKVGFIAATLTAINVFFVFYSQEARGYSLLLFLTTLSSYFFIDFIKGSRRAGYLYLLVATLSLYVHFYAFFVLLAQMSSVAFLPKNNWKQVFISFIPIIFSLPLFIAPSIHSNQTQWIPMVTPTSIIGTFLVLSGDMPFNLIIYAGLIVTLVKAKRSLNEWYLLVWLVVPIITAILISFFKPIYQSIYFIICLVPFILLASLALSKIRRNWIVYSLVALLFLFSSVRLFTWYTRYESFDWIINDDNENYREATQYILQHETPGDKVIFYGYFARQPFELYGVKNIVEISSGPYAEGGGKELPPPNTSLIESFTYPHIWFVNLQVGGHSAIRANQHMAEIKKTLEMHYKLVKEHSFFVVSVHEYAYIINSNH